MDQRGVTLQRAGELIGGDKPLSVRTISAMITRAPQRGAQQRTRSRGGALDSTKDNDNDTTTMF